MLRVFEVFNNKVAELRAYSICKCDACANIDHLRIKVIVHSGEALFHKIRTFYELAGVDVITVHRLLKNSIHADQYLLMTERATRDLTLPDDIERIESEEVYDVGTFKTHVWFPSASSDYAPDPSEPFSQSSVAVEILRYEIQQEYCEVANKPERGFHFHLGRPLTEIVEYPEAWLETIPESTIESFAGTGNPLSLGEIGPCEHVVAIGCVAGVGGLLVVGRGRRPAREIGEHKQGSVCGELGLAGGELGRRSGEGTSEAVAFCIGISDNPVFRSPGDRQ